MACINVTAVQVLDNPAAFKNPLQFEISFECLAPIGDGARGAWRAPRAPPRARSAPPAPRLRALTRRAARTRPYLPRLPFAQTSSGS